MQREQDIQHEYEQWAWARKMIKYAVVWAIILTIGGIAIWVKNTIDDRSDKGDPKSLQDDTLQKKTQQDINKVLVVDTTSTIKSAKNFVPEDEWEEFKQLSTQEKSDYLQNR